MKQVFKKLKVYYSVILGSFLSFLLNSIMAKTIGSTVAFIIVFIVIFLLMNRSLQNDFIKYERMKNQEE